MQNFIRSFIAPFRTLRDRAFAQIYFAQTISLIGDAFTWVGIALLAYEFGGKRSAAILSTALTLRVLAFIIFAPFAGVLADKIDRKKILYTTHFIRMIIVGCLPFVNAEWQIYTLMFLLNVFNAFFTPTYKAVIPQVVTKKEDYSQAIALSNATYQLLGILGPGLAGIMAAWFGARQIFLIDAFTFIVAGILIVTMSGTLIARSEANSENEPLTSTWKDVLKGTTVLFGKADIRFALLLEFAAAIAGAHILVNTIGYIKIGLHLSDKHYGWVMAVFAAGATVAAFASALDTSKNKRKSIIAGVLLLSLAIIGANYVYLLPLMALWLLAGVGQSLAEIPSQTLIAENIPQHQHGRVYGAHFAWSHLWWAIAYPIAGFTGSNYTDKSFFIGGCLSLIVLAAIWLYYRLRVSV